jgi:hypothetical protein
MEKTSAFKILYNKQLLTNERAEQAIQQEREALAKQAKTADSTQPPPLLPWSAQHALRNVL